MESRNLQLVLRRPDCPNAVIGLKKVSVIGPSDETPGANVHREPANRQIKVGAFHQKILWAPDCIQLDRLQRIDLAGSATAGIPDDPTGIEQFAAEGKIAGSSLHLQERLYAEKFVASCTAGIESVTQALVTRPDGARNLEPVGRVDGVFKPPRLLLGGILTGGGWGDGQGDQRQAESGDEAGLSNHSPAISQCLHTERAAFPGEGKAALIRLLTLQGQYSLKRVAGGLRRRGSFLSRYTR